MAEAAVVEAEVWKEKDGNPKISQKDTYVVVSKIFIFTPTWGNDPIWQIFFRLVETTN